MSSNALGCVLEYKMDDNAASSAVVDSSGEGNNGTYKDADTGVNTSTGTTTGKINAALDFDTDEHVDVGATLQATFRGSFSISVRVKPDDGLPSPAEDYIGSENAASEDEIFVRSLISGKVRFKYGSDGDSVTLTTTNAVFADGQETWHHIVVVADSTIAGVGGTRIYFDGALATSLSGGDTSAITFADFTTVDDLYVGVSNIDGTPTNYFNGPIDNVRIFNRALSADEVRILYNANNGLAVLGELDIAEERWDRTLRRIT